MKYLQLNDIDCYKRALSLSNYVWDIVIQWDWFAKRTVGIQFVTAIDSISANSVYQYQVKRITMKQLNNETII